MEKRKDKRVDVKMVAIIESGDYIIKGYVKNVSLSGAFFIGYDEIPEKLDFCRVRIVKDYEFLKTLRSKVVRQETMGDEMLRNFDFGLQFEEDEKKIEKIIGPLIA